MKTTNDIIGFNEIFYSSEVCCYDCSTMLTQLDRLRPSWTL